MTHFEKILYSAWSAEIQAIAIYEAEVFWCRHPEKRTELIRILNEERHHRDQMQAWVQDRRIVRKINQIAGWILGSSLVWIPEPYFSKIQSWAEWQASEIYKKAASDLERSGVGDASVREQLIEAANQEAEHARFFADRARRLKG